MRYESTQLVREETRENGRVVELIEWTRDGQGRPVTRVRRTRGTTRTTEWTYNASGAEQEATFENGTLVQRRLTEADGSITVEQYRDGALVVRDLTDSTGTRRREIWSNGARIRVEE
jgi:YD repeat-containing protein